MELKIAEFITQYPDWYVENDVLMSGFEFTSFAAVKEAVDKIMKIAEEENHHPEVTFDYSTILVKTVTHDSDNSITDKDLALAKNISDSVK